MLETISQLKPEIIVAGGTTLALLYLIYTNRLRDKEWNKLLVNHLEHDLEARGKLTKVLDGLLYKLDEDIKADIQVHKDVKNFMKRKNK